MPTLMITISFKKAYLLKMTQEQMNQGIEEDMKMQNDFEAKLKGKPFPDFRLTDLSGTTHTIREY